MTCWPAGNIYTKTKWLKQSLIVPITSYNIVLLMLIWSKKCWGCQGIQYSLSFLSFSKKSLNWHVFSLCNGLSWRVLLLLHWLLKFLLKIGEMNSSPNIVPSFLELLRVLPEVLKFTGSLSILLLNWFLELLIIYYYA